MRRRLFLSSSSAAVALVLTGCGGGGGGSSTASGAAGTPAAGAAAAGLDLPVSVATPTPVAAATAQAAVPATGYPFGSRLNRYVAGIRPSQSNETMDALLTNQYDAWKAANVVKADSVVAGGYAVQFTNRAYMTVSEGMGYGMLLAVLFHGHDPQAQQLFDGLLGVVRARPAYGIVEQGHFASGKYLMDWRLNADGSSGGGGWNAMDGDLDIAMALLMADRQWGSTGKWNYLEEGKATINAMKDFNMRPDGTTKGLPGAGTSRTSDYMIGHFRAFQKATGDALWNTAIDRAYQLSDRMQTVYSAGVGLMPDFIVGTDTTSPYPSPGGMGDGNMDEDKYWWNACRNPWRYSSDYLLSGDTRWKTITVPRPPVATAALTTARSVPAPAWIRASRASWTPCGTGTPRT
jgi:endoglucanase